MHKAFALSVKATKGFCPDIIRFKISYFGWALLSVLILPLLWSLPYFSTANAIYAKYLMERFEHGTAKAADAVNTLEHQQNGAFEHRGHGASTAGSQPADFEHAAPNFEHRPAASEPPAGEFSASPAPDDSFYVRPEHPTSTTEHGMSTTEHTVSTNEHAPDDFGFTPLSPDRAEELSNHGAGKNPEEFIEKIKSLGEEEK